MYVQAGKRSPTWTAHARGHLPADLPELRIVAGQVVYAYTEWHVDAVGADRICRVFAESGEMMEHNKTTIPSGRYE